MMDTDRSSVLLNINLYDADVEPATSGWTTWLKLALPAPLAGRESEVVAFLSPDKVLNLWQRLGGIVLDLRRAGTLPPAIDDREELRVLTRDVQTFVAAAEGDDEAEEARALEALVAALHRAQRALAPPVPVAAP